MNNDVWIGLATVRPADGNTELDEAKGAAVNVLYLATSREDFIDKVMKKLAEYGYILEELEDIELFDFNVDYKDNLQEVATIAVITKKLQWGTFYTF
ncbi:MAG: hypothetical protein J0M29_08840 [Chitinophagales bacterium]|nr:hypothetical protein [Chitinophagales bacterium]